MRIAVSFLCTDFEKLKEHWHSNSSSKIHTGTNIGMGNVKANEKGIEPFLGGKIIILDWEKQMVIWDMDIDAAGGFFIEGDILSINNMRLHYISIIDMEHKKELNRIMNPIFNCLHSLEKTKNGCLLSSTGTDLVVEVDQNGESVFEWWAVDHGYNKLPNGKSRTLPKNINHNEYVYPTLSQTTHVNSAVDYDEHYILSTLFHQGQLVKIDRRTGRHEVLLRGLTCPHGVKRYCKGWVISNTKANEILMLNENFECVKVIQGEYEWIQDNCPITNGNILVADANHHRVVEIDPTTNIIKQEYKFSGSWRIYQVSMIDK